MLRRDIAYELEFRGGAENIVIFDYPDNGLIGKSIAEVAAARGISPVEAPVFVGTRVPLKNLIDYLSAGHTLDEFLEDFPSVTREQAVTVLELAEDVLSAGARSAR
ncbi:MAG: DUF433 domain-containing protein [Gemmatimonadetes bacterium]|nr:DUF433 domain-containing protein [Gemmatimonadota bacterium]